MEFGDHRWITLISKTGGSFYMYLLGGKITDGGRHAWLFFTWVLRTLWLWADTSKMTTFLLFLNLLFESPFGEVPSLHHMVYLLHCYLLLKWLHCYQISSLNGHILTRFPLKWLLLSLLVDL